MSDLVEVLAAAASHPAETGMAVVAGDGLRRVLGPSVTAVGRALGDFTDFRLRNLLQIDGKVAARLGTGDDSHEKTVHPRVAKQVLDEGSWIDSDLHQEYLAGVLVGARSKDAVSDAHSYLARIVTGLTAEQVRLHYALVNAYAGYWDGSDPCPFPFDHKDQYRRHSLLVRADELEHKFPTLGITATGLKREGLVSDHGRPEASASDLTATHYAFVLTPLAFDLYLECFARPGTMGRKGLMLARSYHDRIAATRPELRLARPTPEPDLFAEVVYRDLGNAPA